MENSKMELNPNEMEQVNGGLRTGMLTAEEVAMYNQLVKNKFNSVSVSDWNAAEKALNDFKRMMEEKYGKVVTSDEKGICIG